MRSNSFTLKRVWIVSELYYPEETSTGYFLTRIAEGLAGRFSVGVLCSQPTYSARGLRAPVNEVRNGVNIHRCWGTTFNKDVLPLRLLNMFTITLAIMLNAVGRIRAGDCVLVVTNPPLLPLVVALACFIRRAKCVLIVHDVYPDVLIATGAFNNGSPLAEIIAYVMCALYRRMDRIVVLGRDMETLIRSKVSDQYKRIVRIPNWADLDLVKPLSRSKNDLLSELGLANKLVIQYSGNIGRTHGIEYLVQCAEQMRNGSQLHFLFIGFGGKKQWLKQAVEDRGLKNVSILEYRPRPELSYSLNACDIAIISLAEGMAGVSVPSRMYNVMAAGKPIIAVADENSELALVVKEDGIGWVVPPGDVDRLCATILEAKANPNLLMQMGQRARQIAETKYSFERVKRAYIEMLTSIYEEAGQRHG